MLTRPPGTRPAPELDRYERNRHERDGYRPAPSGGPDQREPVAMLAGILDRDDAPLSATQTRQRALANADHLAVLGAIWAAETWNAHEARYRAMVMQALPQQYRHESSHRARWLYQT